MLQDYYKCNKKLTIKFKYLQILTSINYDFKTYLNMCYTYIIS